MWPWQRLSGMGICVAPWRSATAAKALRIIARRRPATTEPVGHVKQSQTEKGAVPCPQGILQGRFCESGRDGRFSCYFIQLPQRLAANSLRSVALGARWVGKPDRTAGNVLQTAENLPNLAGIPSHARSRRMGKGGRGVAILPRRISAVPTATSHDPRVAVGTAERTLRSNWTPRPPLPTRRAVIVADDRPPAARSFRTGSRSYGFRSDRRRTGPACSSGATRRGRPGHRSSVRRSP